MADNENTAAGAGKGTDNTGKTWTNHAVSVLALTTSLAMGGLLFGTFWLGRPHNLSPQTQNLANLLEIALVDNYIPQQDIERGETVQNSNTEGNKTTHWTAQTFQVTVPTRLDNDGLRKLLRKDMNVHNVRMVAGDRDPAHPDQETVLFYLGNFAFAEMTLLPSVAEAVATYRSDLRSSSNQLADLTDKLLETLELSSSHTRERSVPKEDLNSLWNYTHFTATLPPGLTLGALKEELESMIALPDARVEIGDRMQGDANLLVSLGGRTCVSLACGVTPVTPQLKPTSPNLDIAMQGSLSGSDPEDVTEETETPAPMEKPAMPDDVAPPISNKKMTVDDTPDVSSTPSSTPSVSAPVMPGAGNGPKRLAIIIDDGGNSRPDSERVLKLDPRLTLAILPNTPYGAETARQGSELGFEIMLHMPMEPHSTTEPAVEGSLYVSMGKKEIQKLTRNALDQYPAVVGINNHTGSKFVENSKKLGYVFEILKKRDLFFIDSFTMNTSVAYETAQKADLRTARRDVFLDNDLDEASIRAQFDVLVKRVVEQGSAIGIGHFHKPNTLKVLASEVPKLKNAGIELVHASELVQ